MASGLASKIVGDLGMSGESKPEVPKLGPYIVEMEPGTYSWCSCGKSTEQPFCDGSHAGTDFEPVEFEVKEKRRVVWCGCKHSKKGAICDGFHSRMG